MTLKDIEKILFEHQDREFGDFHARLVPTVPRDQIIGIRSPEYKAVLKQIKDDPVVPKFLAKLPHKWYEENYLHAQLINRMKDYNECIESLERFMPYIDNWAVNDCLNPKCFKKNRADLIGRVNTWMKSDETYTRRCAMKIFMANFLDEDFKQGYLDLPADLRSDEYYVNIMTAWLFAEALTKQWDAAVKYIEDKRLDQWTHNKAIQKACESYRIPDERKEYLRSLKLKDQKS